MREIGKNLYGWSFAHAVRVDRDDNIWVTDKGSDLVIKFTPAGQVAMVIGRKQEASDEDTGPGFKPSRTRRPPAEDGRFRQVTDITWGTHLGNTYISDGYINSLRRQGLTRTATGSRLWGPSVAASRASSARRTAYRL